MISARNHGYVPQNQQIKAKTGYFWNNGYAADLVGLNWFSRQQHQVLIKAPNKCRMSNIIIEYIRLSALYFIGFILVELVDFVVGINYRISSNHIF